MSTLEAAKARTPYGSLAVSCAITIGLLSVYLPGGRTARLTVLVLVAGTIAAYVATVHPLATFRLFALILAVVPYMHVPGTGIPLLLVLSVGIWVSLVSLRGVDFRPGWPEVWMAAIAAVALLSVLATGVSKGSLIEWIAWIAATAVVIPIRFLPESARASVIRTFVLGTAAAAVVGIALVILDPSGQFLGRLSFVGYDATGNNVQLVPGTEVNTIRLTGTFVEPNIAGLILTVGLLLALAHFRRAPRVLLTVVIGAALLLTLSRAALATVVVAIVLLVLISGGRRRGQLLLAGAAAGLGSLAIPTVRERLFNSFGPSDTGSIARALAFQDFPQQLSGHWWWGLGWDREEFRDPVVGRMVNFVANAPLLTIYRGGLVLGGLLVAVLIVIVLRSLVASRRSFPDSVVCCGVIGLTLVALQLDFPVVIQPPATAVFSFLLGISLAAHPRGGTHE